MCGKNPAPPGYLKFNLSLNNILFCLFKIFNKLNIFFDKIIFFDETISSDTFSILLIFFLFLIFS